MKNIFYSIAAIIIVSASSCSKQCVQCQAAKSDGYVVNSSNVICDHSLNRKNFEDRYKKEFQDYTVTCSNK